ncbi:hypothetical protein QBC34DRAFT_379344 [Podospora aff. communis PSN243]|uniref:Uncharacterized protein n=1 Tax=Podospora aff. communis PSN243 TaxID=3040156 RepID=A0AAV9GSV4_9PEZI|nr:hypothetical protein QBC34DRAFT_379344 [Podospora aff. communis PSN243]
MTPTMALSTRPIFHSLGESVLGDRDILRTQHVQRSLSSTKEREPELRKMHTTLVKQHKAMDDPRPSDKHFRVCMYYAQVNKVQLHWAKSIPERDQLVLDIPELSEFYVEMSNQAAAMDMARGGNPNSPVVRFAYGGGGMFGEIPHGVVGARNANRGIAVCYASNWNRTDPPADKKWANRTILSLGPPGSMYVWPGPVVFVRFEYPAATPGPRQCNLVDFDLSASDFDDTVSYLRHLPINNWYPSHVDKGLLNPSSAWSLCRGALLTPLRHDTVYTRLGIQSPPITHLEEEKGVAPDLSLQDISFDMMAGPGRLRGHDLYPLAAAFAVGLYWLVMRVSVTGGGAFADAEKNLGECRRYDVFPNVSTQILTKGAVSKSARRVWDDPRSHEVVDRVDSDPGDPVDPKDVWFFSMPSSDSYIIFDPSGRAVSKYHVYALLEFIRNTHHSKWCPSIFHSYWNNNKRRIVQAVRRNETTAANTTGSEVVAPQGPCPLLHSPYHPRGQQQQGSIVDTLNFTPTFPSRFADRTFNLKKPFLPPEEFRGDSATAAKKRPSMWELVRIITLLKGYVVGDGWAATRWREGRGPKTPAELNQQKNEMREVESYAIAERRANRRDPRARQAGRIAQLQRMPLDAFPKPEKKGESSDPSAASDAPAADT